MHAAGHLMPTARARFNAQPDFHCGPKPDLFTSIKCWPTTGLETPYRDVGERLGCYLRGTEKAMDYVSLFRSATSFGKAAQVLTKGLVARQSFVSLSR